MTMATPVKSLLVHLDGTARAEIRLRLAHQFAVAPVAHRARSRWVAHAVPDAGDAADDGRADQDHHERTPDRFARACVLYL